MTKILITGANGFIGQHLGKRLAGDGYQLVAVCRRDNVELNYAATQFAIGDIGAETDWTAALQGVDVVVHLAARVHVMNEKSSDPLSEFRQVNTRGTLSLAEQAARAGVKRLIYLSSIKVNGEATAESPFTAEDIPAPEDAYAISKLEAEQGLMAIAAKTSLEIVIIRPPLVYGPGVGGNFRRLMTLVNKMPLLPLGGLQNRRSLVSVWNISELIKVCLSHPRAAGEIFLVSDGQDLSTTELLKKLSQQFQSRIWLFWCPPVLLRLIGKLTGQLSTILRLTGSLQVDISRAERILDWKPDMGVDQAIRETCQWYQDTFLPRP